MTAARLPSGVFPAVLLTGKGVPADPAPMVWMREVGVLIVALSTMLLLVRGQPDSPALRAMLWANAMVYAGLLATEILAWHGGVITRLDGIAPNSVLHVAVALGSAYYATRIVAHSKQTRVGLLRDS